MLRAQVYIKNKPNTMASFQLVSDIHLEAPPAYDLFDIPSKAPYLAILGDIGYVKTTAFLPSSSAIFESSKPFS